MQTINEAKGPVWTCGTAILSRLAAYGMGTSAPAILSTGASRYSKLSSTTDMLQRRHISTHYKILTPYIGKGEGVIETDSH
jgi:hypothetical protein